jgi:hypothetical protein
MMPPPELMFEMGGVPPNVSRHAFLDPPDEFVPTREAV